MAAMRALVCAVIAVAVATPAMGQRTGSRQPRHPLAPVTAPPTPTPVNPTQTPPSGIRPDLDGEELPGALPDSPFSTMSVEEARDKSIREHKVLILIDTSRPVQPAPGRRLWYENLAVRSWIHWHAVMVKVAGPEAAPQGLRRSDCPSMSVNGMTVDHRPYNNEYRMAIAIMGRLECHLPFLDDQDPITRKMLPGRITAGVPSGVGALFGMDFVLECVKARDPAFALSHEKDNPPPPPPDQPSPLYSRNDGDAQSVSDLFAAPGQPRPDVLGRLLEVRRLAGESDRFGAAGLATWLWERGATVDPDFESARLSTLVRLMHDIAGDPGPGHRFKAILERAVAGLPWADFHDYYVFCMACRAAASPLREIEILNELVNDPDNEAMMPAADGSAFKAVFGAVDLVDKPVEQSVKWIRKIRALLGSPRPSAIPREDWPKLQAVRRWLVVHESARAFAMLCAAGREDEARALLAETRKVSPDADPARRFVITAAAEGAGKAWMADLLEDPQDLVRNHLGR